MEKIVSALITIAIVPVVLIGYILLVEWSMQRLPQRRADRIRPLLWVLPAVAMLVIFLIGPALTTLWFSLWNFDRAGVNFTSFAGIDHYITFFTNNETLTALRNNVLWVVLLPALAVGLGLVIAVLVDRVRYETVVKSIIFLPMAISFVAATVIWKLVYDFDPRVGLLNAIGTALGFDRIAWVQQSQPLPINTIALIIIGAWMLTGFAMVILSAGLKAIPTELLEASRVDGANEWQVFRNVVFPLLLPTIAVITTTVVIFALKTFDIVYTMTAGNFATEVIANRMYKEMVTFRAPGQASATAVVLLVAIVPVMIYNIRRFREQEALR
ncbi:MAG: sugar ABC transporter permease [Chloroflexota bacterium]|nr:sugar ABC transporter permease [Chloroflexota bacterium]